MVTPLSAARTHRLELSKESTKSDADTELAMVATVFKKLQDAGLVPPGARLSDRPGGWSANGPTYEAQLHALIADTNGRLGLDLDALSGSKLVNGVTADQLEELLAGPSQGLGEAFLKRQGDDLRLARAALLTPKGAAVERASEGMVLTTEQDRSTNDFVSKVGERIAKDPKATRAVQNEAIGGAAVLVQKGDLKRARELLVNTADALAAAGRLDEARTVATELTKAPLASSKLNLAQTMIDQQKVVDPSFDPVSGGIKGTSGAGNTVTLKPSEYATTSGELGKLKQSQYELQAKMEKVLGKHVVPQNIDDARAYFQAFAKHHTGAEVAAEYQSYLKGFFKHSGIGVDWTNAIPQDERGARVGELLDAQVADDGGRKVIDCEGYAYLTENLLGGIADDKGEKRFNVLYASRQGHVITGVVDPKSSEVFTVNNDTVSQPTKVRSDAEAVRVIGQSLIGSQGSTIFGVGRSQSQSNPRGSTEPYAPPKVGTLVWDGKGVVGTVTPEVAARYQEFSRRTGLGSESYGRFLDWLVNESKKKQ